MGIHKSVADQKTVFMGDENFLFGENHSTDAISGAGHALTVELADVLVTVGAVDATLIAVDAESPSHRATTATHEGDIPHRR